MIDTVIDGVYGFQIFLSSVVLLMKGTGAQQMGKLAGINHILFLYPFSSSADGWLRAGILHPVQQIWSATVNLPVNTDPPLDGADYHAVY